MIETKELKLTEIEKNKGQIEGLPANPRTIRDHKFEKLVKSIEENPEMLALRELLVFPHGGKYVVIGGNMRYEALKKLGYKTALCKIIPQETTVEQLKAYTIKDNNGFGEWDFDMLANEWDTVQLENWGLTLPVWGINNTEGVASTDSELPTENNEAGEGNLPEELLGMELTPDALPKIEGSNETEYDRIIIVFPKDKKEDLGITLGIELNKVLFKYEDGELK